VCRAVVSFNAAIRRSEATELTRNIIELPQTTARQTGTRGRQFSEVMWAVPRADDTAEEREVLRVSCVGRLSPMTDRIAADDCAEDSREERQVRLVSCVSWLGRLPCTCGKVQKTELDYSAHLH